MTPGRLFSLLCLVVGVAGCAFGYQARGSLGDVAAELRGKGYPDNTKGGGRFALATGDGRLACDGLAFPPKTAAEPGRCAGERGDGIVRCSDGREIAIQWEAITCRSWRGAGVDAQGNRLEFRVERW